MAEKIYTHIYIIEVIPSSLTAFYYLLFHFKWAHHQTLFHSQGISSLSYVPLIKYMQENR